MLHSQIMHQKYSSLQSYMRVTFISFKSINIKGILYLYKYVHIYILNKLYTYELSCISSILFLLNIFL